MNLRNHKNDENNKPHEILQNHLRRLMLQKKISEAELVRQTRIPQTTINKILTGETTDPRISTLQTLAEYFDTTVDNLYIESGETYLSKSTKIQPIPIISWTSCINGIKYIDSLNASNWDNWIVVEPVTKFSFGLISKPSMEPTFPRDTILIISPETTPADGDLVIVHYKETKEATLRELVFKGKNKQLITINESSSGEPLNNEIKILGVLIEARLCYHKS